jgi:hypothetical protein
MIYIHAYDIHTYTYIQIMLRYTNNCSILDLSESIAENRFMFYENLYTWMPFFSLSFFPSKY